MDGDQDVVYRELFGDGAEPGLDAGEEFAVLPRHGLVILDSGTGSICVGVMKWCQSEEDVCEMCS